MRYLGGKAKIAKHLAKVILEHTAGIHIWEPFVGGANMTPHIRSAVASDRHAALIAMYQAVHAGWTPPENVSEDEYQAAKLLPDSDPLKAFCGFACSFGGMWFQGFAGPETRLTYIQGVGECTINAHPARAAGRSLRKLRELRTIWLRADFCAVVPFEAPGWAIYADPPYAGTTGYGMDFDHGLFWARCQGWVRLGVPVLVSEYSCPVAHEVVWERERNLEMHTTRTATVRTERLFRVLP